MARHSSARGLKERDNVDKRKDVGGKARAAVARNSKLAAVQVIFHARIGQSFFLSLFSRAAGVLRS